MPTNDGWEVVPQNEASDTGWEAVPEDETGYVKPNKQQTAPPAIKKPDLENLDWITNQFKVGATEGVALLSALAQVGVVDPVRMLAGGQVDGTALDRFVKTLKQNQQTMLDVTGGDPSQTKGDNALEDLFGAGLRAVSDPTSYIGAPAKLGALGWKAAESFGAGVGSDAGAKAGSQAERAITGEEGGMIGTTAGALLGGVASIPATSALEQVGKSAYEGYRGAGEATEKMVSGYAKEGKNDLVRQVSNQEGVDNLKARAEEFTDISKYVDSEEGISAAIANADNATIKQYSFAQARDNANSFRSKLDKERMELSAKLEKKLDDTFGQRFAPVEGDIVSQQAKDISANLEGSIKAVDDKLAQLSGTYSTAVGANEKLGGLVSKLVEDKKELVKKQLSPVYDKVIQEATDAGVTMPKEGVESIYNFVTENKLSDLFGRGTPLDNRIQTFFKPKNVEVETPLADRQTLFSNKLKPNQTKLEFQEVPFKAINSLKKEINRLQRTLPQQSDKQYILKQLEDKVNNARELMDGDFNQRLKDVDASYYEKMGVPFGAQGIKDIDAKKYAEEVSEVITKNGTALRDFISVVGETDGHAIARNAILSEIDAKMIDATTGEFNEKKMTQYLKDNADVISQVPKLKEELESTIIRSELLKENKNSLQQSLKLHDKEVADNVFTNLGGVYKDYNNVVATALKGSKGLLALERDIGNLTPATQASIKNVLRRELIDIARGSSEGAVAFFADPKNKFVVNRLMGDGYAKDIANISKLSDALIRSDMAKVNFSGSDADLDPMKQLTGVDSQYLFSQFRDRISSVPQKVFRVGSKAYETKAKAAFDEEISGFLLDKDWTRQVGNLANEFEVDPYKAINSFMRLMSNKVPARSIIASKSIMNESEPLTIEIGRPEQWDNQQGN